MSDQSDKKINPKKSDTIQENQVNVQVIKVNGVEVDQPTVEKGSYEEPLLETKKEETSPQESQWEEVQGAKEEKSDSLPPLPKNNKAKKKNSAESSLFNDVLDFIKIFAGTAIVILLFVNFIAHPVTVVGHSMDPTLANGEYGLTSLISVALSSPNRGDIVIVNRKSEDGETERWVKRIIGLPGETVEAKDGVVYIDGEPLDESSYLDSKVIEEFLAKYKAEHGVNYGPYTSDFGPITLGEDEYWVMGDNRPYSKDSRHESVGPISKESLFGKGMLVLYPFDKAGVK